MAGKCLIKLIFFLSLLGIISQGGHPAAAQGEKPREGILPITAGEKTIEAITRAYADGTWIETGSFAALWEALGAKCSFDPAIPLLAVSINRNTARAEGLPVPGITPLAIALNGEIYRVPCKKEEKSYFIPLKVLENCLNAAGFVLEQAPGQKGAAIREKPTGEAPAAATPPAKAPVPADRAQIKDYMDRLKTIFDKYKPAGNEMEIFQDILLNPGSGKKKGDPSQVAGKYSQALEELKALTPPDAETREINDLAKGVFEGMGRMIALAADLLKMEKGYDSPETLEKIHELNRMISRDSALFDQKVKDIRKKYDLGPP
jgi:hypothetical protein